MDKKRPYWWSTLVLWSASACVAGLSGAMISRTLGAPAYFGGIFGFCLVGMSGLFALAARIAKKP